MSLSYKKFLISIFCLSFFIRFLFFIIFINFGDRFFRASNDAREYNDIAIQISNGNGISLSKYYAPGFYNLFKNTQRPEIAPDFYRLPGYPIFLAFFYKLFGQNPTIPILFQIFISSLIPILVFFLSLTLFPNILLAKVSAIISVFYFGFVLYSCILLSETFFLFFFILFLIFFFKSFRLFFCKQNKIFDSKFFILAGICLGLASLIRAVGPILLSVSLFLLICSSFMVSEKLKASFILFLSWLGVVFSWLLRNWMLTGHIFFHSLPGVHFFSYPAVRLGMKNYDCGYFTARSIMLNDIKNKVENFTQEKGVEPNEFEMCMIYENYAHQIFKQNFLNFSKLSIYHMLRTMFSIHQIKYDNVIFYSVKDNFEAILWNKILDLWIYLEYFLLLGFILFFLISLFKFDLFCVLCSVGPFIFALIFITLAEGLARLRLPVMPLIIILGVYFWILFFEYFLKLRKANILNFWP